LTPTGADPHDARTFPGRYRASQVFVALQTDDRRSVQCRFGMPRELDGASPVRARYCAPTGHSLMTREASHAHAIHRSAQHVHVWLSASGLTYGAVARESFVRAHPHLFGRAYALTLHGFERWIKRHAITDSVEAFARFIARRHQRWMGS